MFNIKLKKCKKIYLDTVVGDYINTIRQLLISILIYILLLNSMDKLKHTSQKKLLIKKASLCLLANVLEVIKKLVNNKK